MRDGVSVFHLLQTRGWMKELSGLLDREDEQALVPLTRRTTVINSAALRPEPRQSSRDKRGSEAMSQKSEKAVLAGGCFWGMQDLIRKRPGVLSTRVGYTGGDVPNATYWNHGTHAEAIEIIFDPEVTSYRELLEFFFQIHDPTTLNRQGNDVGASYRSAIFYLDEEQRRVAEDTIADVEASGLWPGKVVTEVTPAGPFWEAEPEHQDYLERYPNGYTCHFPRPGWVLPRRSAAAR
jgi:peptide-methionine (S)-S-oxide reductase